MKFYTPADWMWIVAGDQTKAFSSKVGDFVPTSGPAYQAWAADGSTPTAIESAAAVGAVLAPYQIRPVNAEALDAYLEAQCDHVVIKLLMKIIFKMNNDIRELKGQAPLTPAQARTFIKGLL